MATAVCQLHSEKAEAWLRRLGDEAPAAAARALNKAVGSGRVVVARSAAKDTGLKVADVTSLLYLRPATAQLLTARLAASNKRLPLIRFAARGPYPSRGRGQVTAMGRSGRHVVPHAFIAVMPSGHRGVFKRDPKRRMRSARHRQAIVELKGPSIAHVALKYAGAGVTRSEMQLAKTMVSELRFSLRSRG